MAVVKILYFASLREAVGCDQETLDVPSEIGTVGALRALLCARGGDWSALAGGRAVRAAVNQVLARPETVIAAGDEVAFFPPVTGG